MEAEAEAGLAGGALRGHALDARLEVTPLQARVGQ